MQCVARSERSQFYHANQMPFGPADQNQQDHSQPHSQIPLWNKTHSRLMLTIPVTNRFIRNFESVILSHVPPRPITPPPFDENSRFWLSNLSFCSKQNQVKYKIVNPFRNKKIEVLIYIPLCAPPITHTHTKHHTPKTLLSGNLTRPQKQ